MPAQPDNSEVLILGKGLHAPWNEGTRVICRNLAQVAALLRQVHVVSLTQAQFSNQIDARERVEHIYTQFGYGAWSDYAMLGQIRQAAARIKRQHRLGVAHLVGMPLALAPWLRQQGLRVVAHVAFAQHAYRGLTERVRAAAGWRCFDHWIDAYACSAEPVRAQLAAQGYPADKLRVVGPAIDVRRFAPLDRAAARQAFGLPADAFIVAYLGTVSPLRFPAAELLRGLRLALGDIPNLRLAVFAPDSTHPYNRQWVDGHLQQAVATSAVPVSVALRDLSDAEKPLLYSAADVVLLPFTAPVAVEPPLTLLEAMACGALVAAAPAANRSRIVAHDRNGLTYSTPEELAGHLRRLATLGPGQRARLSAAARTTIVERHSFAAVARELLDVWAAPVIEATAARLLTLNEHEASL